MLCQIIITFVQQNNTSTVNEIDIARVGRRMESILKIDNAMNIICSKLNVYNTK